MAKNGISLEMVHFERYALFGIKKARISTIDFAKITIFDILAKNGLFLHFCENRIF